MNVQLQDSKFNSPISPNLLIDNKQNGKNSRFVVDSVNKSSGNQLDYDNILLKAD